MYIYSTDYLAGARNSSGFLLLLGAMPGAGLPALVRQSWSPAGNVMYCTNQCTVLYCTMLCNVLNNVQYCIKQWSVLYCRVPHLTLISRK